MEQIEGHEVITNGTKEVRLRLESWEKWFRGIIGTLLAGSIVGVGAFMVNTSKNLEGIRVELIQVNRSFTQMSDEMRTHENRLNIIERWQSIMEERRRMESKPPPP